MLARDQSERACGQCPQFGLRTGSYIVRFGPDSVCFRGSPVCQDWNAVRVPHRGRVFPVQHAWKILPREHPPPFSTVSGELSRMGFAALPLLMRKKAAGQRRLSVPTFELRVGGDVTIFSPCLCRRGEAHTFPTRPATNPNERGEASNPVPLIATSGRASSGHPRAPG